MNITEVNKNISRLILLEKQRFTNRTGLTPSHVYLGQTTCSLLMEQCIGSVRDPGQMGLESIHGMWIMRITWTHHVGVGIASEALLIDKHKETNNG